jgi:hypothetical protein
MTVFDVAARSASQVDHRQVHSGIDLSEDALLRRDNELLRNCLMKFPMGEEVVH